MSKETLSFVAIFLMFLCNFIIIFARKINQPLLRFLVKTVAFIILLITLGMILIVLFA